MVSLESSVHHQTVSKEINETVNSKFTFFAGAVEARKVLPKLIFHLTDTQHSFLKNILLLRRCHLFGYFNRTAASLRRRFILKRHNKNYLELLLTVKGRKSASVISNVWDLIKIYKTWTAHKLDDSPGELMRRLNLSRDIYCWLEWCIFVIWSVNKLLSFDVVISCWRVMNEMLWKFCDVMHRRNSENLATKILSLICLERKFISAIQWQFHHQVSPKKRIESLPK